MMFWGLNLKPNRKYSQTTSKNFHISQAALEDGENSKVYITSGNQKFLICTLENDGGSRQVFLDLNFAEGEEVCFQTVGSGNVTLSGYIIANYESDDDDDEDGDDMSREELLKQLVGEASKKSAKLAKDRDSSEDEEEDDSDDEDDQEVGGDEEDDDDDEEDDDDDEEDEEDEDEEEEVQEPKAKKNKLEKANKNEKHAQAKQNGTVKKVAEVVADKKSKKDKKDDKKGAEQKQPQQQAGVTRVITGGVKVEDTRVGNGPEAKNGKRAFVYYEGRLKSNNQVFDSHKQGKGFAFGVGRGEVIKGWEVGIVGMKVGGKRRITCPPHMAYGSRGSAPSIPPNSTLVFDIELKGVN